MINTTQLSRNVIGFPSKMSSHKIIDIALNPSKHEF